MNRENAIQVEPVAANIDDQPPVIESSPAQAGDKATPSAPTPEEIWQQHCMNAVKSFLKNVVIVDNEPYTPPENAQLKTIQAPLAIPVDVGMGGVQAAAELSQPVTTQTQGDALTGGADLTAHRLDIIEISDSFADAGLSCAFVLPKDTDTDSDAKKKRALKAAKAADVLIIDWHLEKQSPELTKEILKELAEQDINEGNRLRLICIYTGNMVTVEILNEAVSALGSGGIDLSKVDGETAKSAACLLAIVNKYTVPSSDLPEKIITLFTKLNDGLIPSFALASVGAIRKNTHHLLTRFESDLDSAYIANRLITDPPEDIAELMRDLLVAEFENSLSYDAVADEYLTPKPIENWLQTKIKTPNSNKAESTETSHIKLETIKTKITKNRKEVASALDIRNEDVQAIEQAIGAKIDNIKTKEKRVAIKKEGDVNMELINQLLKHGINDKGVNKPASETPQIDIHESNRKHISAFLSGSTQESINRENKFSRMVALRREAFGSHKAPWNTSWVPSITTGTILKLKTIEKDKKNESAVEPNGENNDNINSADSKEKSTYYICLTPACDTLRLEEKSAFSFIKAEENTKSYNLVVKNEDGLDLHLKFSTKSPEIFTFKFAPDPIKKRVIGERVDDGNNKFKFPRSDVQEFIWMGEMRYSRAVSEIAKISSTWMRIGLIDSEHLRIAAKG
ncbi:hypothetical protein KI614_14375 [Dechloromonas denitrificans]|uniref:response regulator receiver domain n=1 Tax=Dechloromonas denitrificans TaxID=281362 RepID=UPI001CF893AA|nr:response regulator receiver domain [Dechloromonas denitrificans]UCV11314.1 hypothetical protein KI614_14375 [Dechloromonas denitrificans]